MREHPAESGVTHPVRVRAVSLVVF